LLGALRQPDQSEAASRSRSAGAADDERDEGEVGLGSEPCGGGAVMRQQPGMCKTLGCNRAVEKDSSHCSVCNVRGERWAVEICDKVFSHYTPEEMAQMRVVNAARRRMQ
jgi:hypothetical protein